MEHEPMAGDDLERACAEAVARLRRRYRWELLTNQEWVSLAAGHLAHGEADDAGRAAVLAYSRALHEACSGRRGPELRERGYGELADYLRGAARLQGDLRDDTVQIALERTYERFDYCRSPGSFLAFALQQLADATRATRRQESRAATQRGDHADSSAADPASGLVSGELRARFEQLAQAFLRAHPRAGRQFMALRLKFVDGLDDSAIAAYLQIPIDNVYVLRSRAIRKLRDSSEWRSLAVEYGIIGE
jgi:RNA polymerase sigma factor (sigma-70 family)